MPWAGGDFFEELRRKMGPGKIIMADIGQHGFGILNGVESEGFPRSRWYDFVAWSERMNKLDYWAAHTRGPPSALSRANSSPRKA